MSVSFEYVINEPTLTSDALTAACIEEFVPLNVPRRF